MLRLTKELAWAEECVAGEAAQRTGELALADRVFKNAISICAAAAKAAYDRLMLRDALKCAWCASALPPLVPAALALCAGPGMIAAVAAAWRDSSWLTATPRPIIHPSP